MLVVSARLCPPGSLLSPYRTATAFRREGLFQSHPPPSPRLVRTAAGLFFLSPNYPQYPESTEIHFAEFLHLLCPSLQLRDITCSTSRHSKWELMRRSPRLALATRPLPSSVNLLLFFLFALCSAALEMEMHTVTPG